MDGLQEKHIDVSRGLHYRYYTTSNNTPVSPSSPALLFCHGFPDDALLWQYVVPLVQQSKLKLIVPDLLGYGGTSKPSDPKEFEEGAMSQDLVEILKQEDITAANTVIPIGHDWGAYLAQRFYMLNSNLCAGLSTLSVAILPVSEGALNVDAMNAMTEKNLGYPIYAYWNLFIPQEGPKLIDSRLESFWHVLHGEGREWMKEMFCVHDGMKKFLEADGRVPLRPYGKDEKLKAQWMASHDPAQGGVGMLSPTNWYRAMASDVHMETEKKIDATIEKPYLFIASTQDPVCRTDGIEIAKQHGLLKDLTVREIDAGHWIPYEKPDEVAQALLQWLESKGFTKGDNRL